MKLPNAENAVVDIDKLRSYCLSTEHFRGKHKARVFKATLGLTAADAELLQAVLYDTAKSGDAVSTNRDEFGQRYVLDFEMMRIRGWVTVRSVWIIRSSETFPRLTTCYVL